MEKSPQPHLKEYSSVSCRICQRRNSTCSLYTLLSPYPTWNVRHPGLLPETVLQQSRGSLSHQNQLGQVSSEMANWYWYTERARNSNRHQLRKQILEMNFRLPYQRVFAVGKSAIFRATDKCPLLQKWQAMETLLALEFWTTFCMTWDDYQISSASKKVKLKLYKYVENQMFPAPLVQRPLFGPTNRILHTSPLCVPPLFLFKC